MTQSKERRSHDRSKLEVPVSIRLSGIDEFVSRYVTDISAGGVFIASDKPYPIGTVVDIQFYLVGKSKHFFKVVGKVIRHHQNPDGMGVRFHEIEQKSQELLRDLLETTKP